MSAAAASSPSGAIARALSTKAVCDKYDTLQRCREPVPEIKQIEWDRLRDGEGLVSFTHYLLTAGAITVKSLFTNTQLKTMNKEGTNLFKNNKQHVNTIILFDDAVPTAVRLQLKVKGRADGVDLSAQASQSLDLVDQVIGTLRDVLPLLVTDSHHVETVSFVKNLEGYFTTPQILHSDVQKQGYSYSNDIVIHIPISPDGSCLDVMFGSHNGRVPVEFGGKEPTAPLGQVITSYGDAFIHLGDFVHGAGPETEGKSRLRIIVLCTTRRRPNGPDKVYTARNTERSDKRLLMASLVTKDAAYAWDYSADDDVITMREDGSAAAAQQQHSKRRGTRTSRCAAKKPKRDGRLAATKDKDHDAALLSDEPSDVSVTSADDVEELGGEENAVGSGDETANGDGAALASGLITGSITDTMNEARSGRQEDETESGQQVDASGEDASKEGKGALETSNTKTACRRECVAGPSNTITTTSAVDGLDEEVQEESAVRERALEGAELARDDELYLELDSYVADSDVDVEAAAYSPPLGQLPDRPGFVGKLRSIALNGNGFDFSSHKWKGKCGLEGNSTQTFAFASSPLTFTHHLFFHSASCLLGSNDGSQ